MGANTEPSEPIPGPIARRPSSDEDPPGPLWTEWLLTNALGGYAMGTVLGVPTRRYHALLVGAAHPPVDRIVALAAIHESVTTDPGGPRERAHFLTPFQFEDADPQALQSPGLTRFERGRSCRWTWRFDTPAGPTLDVRKTVHLMRGVNAVAVRYELSGAPCRLELRPLIALRDFHALEGGEGFDSEFEIAADGGAIRVEHAGRAMSLTCEGGRLTPIRERWRGIEHAWERMRGLESSEDLLAPAVVSAEVEPGGARIEVRASLGDACDRTIEADTDLRRAHEQALIRATLGRAPSVERRETVTRLVLAGDEFVVRRADSDADGGVSVIAGYPWFSDWGRDAMISLPGLLLVTRRHAEAMDVLCTFARARRNGLIPNRFDDRSGPAHYNTVDASLWFVHACHEYLAAGGDRGGFDGELAPACADIVDAYTRGTDFGIGVDPDDGLVFAGDEATQLTWMDAQRDGVTFTPRHGKACEINALWYNALAALAESAPTRDTAVRYRQLADRAGASFRKAFVDPEIGLIDHLRPDGGRWARAGGVRPNQVFAASLPRSALSHAEKSRVVEIVRTELVTPLGVRTLGRAGDERSAYCAHYRGSLFERDAAYHNGTAWPWLLGPFAEAVMRVGGFSEASRREARASLEPLMDWVEGGWSPGQVPEVFDAEAAAARTQRPDGCPAQAWSVAELLRVWLMAGSPRP